MEENATSGSAKSSDNNTDISNRIFIMGGTIVKQVRCYEISRRLQK